MSKAVKNKKKPRPRASKPISKMCDAKLFSPQESAILLKNELLSVSHRRVDTWAADDCSTTSDVSLEDHNIFGMFRQHAVIHCGQHMVFCGKFVGEVAWQQRLFPADHNAGLEDGLYAWRVFVVIR